ncbi:DUF3450 domain-containing protein [Desulfocicer niacini]
MKSKKNRISSLICVAALFFMSIYPSGGESADTAQGFKKPVEQSIETRRESQKKLEQWEQKKARLIAEYEQLKKENKVLKESNGRLSTEATGHRELVESLVEQKQANLRIQKEMLPFLKETQAALEALVTDDPPFLREERTVRLEKLRSVMDDLEITIAEKYRKVMEALFVEAEYGNTIEVSQDKIDVAGNEVLADIFRLGRISLFALSLDGQSAARFNVAANKWDPLGDAYVQPVHAAVEMGKKRRTVEIFSLPIGKLATN